MSDGSSGLSLSEMGISTVKKTAQAVKKQAAPFVQGAKQQIIGQTTNPAPTGSKPPSETIISGVFDLFAPDKNQPKPTQNPSQTPIQSGQNPQQAFHSQAAQPPNEAAPAMSGTFDLKSLTGNDQALFEQGQTQNQPQNDSSQKPVKPTSANPFATMKSEQEKQQQIQDLRKQLHDAYYEQFEKQAEGKDEKGETAQEREARLEQEKQQQLLEKQKEEEKKKPILPPGVQGRQGAHEGLKNRG